MKNFPGEGAGVTQLGTIYPGLPTIFICGDFFGLSRRSFLRQGGAGGGAAGVRGAGSDLR